MSRSGVPVERLETKPQRLVDVANRVFRGDILLPKFQREFVWSREQVRDLLDSVARDYPIGSILLWKSHEDLASERTIAGLDVELPEEGYPRNYLLDGQQRLSTICGALYWQPDGDPRSLWNLAYDLDAETFLHLTMLEDPPAHQVPMRLLSEPAEYFKRSAGLPQPLSTRAEQLFNRIAKYDIAVATVSNLSANEVARVFERINSTATTLTVVDLTRAATWARDFDLSDLFGEIVAVLDTKRFGTVDEPTLLRAVSAACGGGFVHDVELLRKRSVAERKEQIQEVAEAAKRAADFLATQLHVPTSAALPYMNQFAVLIELFRRLPKPTADQYDAIERWFWTSALGGHFRGWNSAQMLADHQAVAEFASGAARELPVPASLPPPRTWATTQFRANNALSKVHALMLAFAGPLDLRTGRRIDVGRALSWSNDKEYHHVFPQAWLRRQRVSAERANAIGNIVMLTSVSNIVISDQRPGAYLQDLCDSDDEDEVRRRCASCLIDAAAFDAAMADDYEAFLETRCATLDSRARELALGA